MAAAFIDGSDTPPDPQTSQSGSTSSAPIIAQVTELRAPARRLPRRVQAVSAERLVETWAETWVTDSVAQLSRFTDHPLDSEAVLRLGHRLAAVEELLVRYSALPAHARSLNRFMILEASTLSAALMWDTLDQPEALWVSDAAMRCYLKALRAVWVMRADALQIYAVAEVFDDYLTRAGRNMRAIAARMAPTARLKLAAVYSPRGLLYAVYRDGRLVHSAVRPRAAERYRDARLVPALERELESFIAQATRTQAKVIESYQKLCGAAMII